MKCHNKNVNFVSANRFECLRSCDANSKENKRPSINSKVAQSSSKINKNLNERPSSKLKAQSASKNHPTEKQYNVKAVKPPVRQKANRQVRASAKPFANVDKTIKKTISPRIKKHIQRLSVANAKVSESPVHPKREWRKSKITSADMKILDTVKRSDSPIKTHVSDSPIFTPGADFRFSKLQRSLLVTLDEQAQMTPPRTPYLLPISTSPIITPDKSVREDDIYSLSLRVFSPTRFNQSESLSFTPEPSDQKSSSKISGTPIYTPQSNVGQYKRVQNSPLVTLEELAQKTPPRVPYLLPISTSPIITPDKSVKEDDIYSLSQRVLFTPKFNQVESLVLTPELVDGKREGEISKSPIYAPPPRLKQNSRAYHSPLLTLDDQLHEAWTRSPIITPDKEERKPSSKKEVQGIVYSSLKKIDEQMRRERVFKTIANSSS